MKIQTAVVLLQVFCNTFALPATTPDQATPSTQQSGPDCPSAPNEEIFLPYEGNCSQYWECFNGGSFLYTCPTGLWWNQDVGQCDAPGDYCNNSSTSTTVTEGTTTTSEPPGNGSIQDHTFFPCIMILFISKLLSHFI